MTRCVKWRQRNTVPDSVSLKTGLSPLTEKLLYARGLTTPEAAREFLDLSDASLHDPFLLKGMDRAVDRILKAVERCEKICIYGDYDVDGITSVAMLYNFLESIGGNVTYHIPEREKEGYGLAKDSLGAKLDLGVTLFISVDCGTTSVEEAAFVASRGADIIITDHHECREELPVAYALLNPACAGSGYPFRHLSGAGVVYKLISALCETMGITGRQEDFLEYAALGTVADVVRMEGENRIIAAAGIRKMNTNPGLGIRALLSAGGAAGRIVDEDTLGYMLAPRINAAGRLENPSSALRLFLTSDGSEAASIADKLCALNRERQAIQETIITEAEAIIVSETRYLNDDVLVIPGEGWLAGIIGIVASGIAEKYCKPCIVISKDGDGLCRGSGRSAAGFNLFEALMASADLLETYGGHEKAAGLSIEAKNIWQFADRMNDIFRESGLVSGIKTNEYDLILNYEQAGVAQAHEISLLAPFGEGNPRPVFAYMDMPVSGINVCGSEGKHLKLKFEHRGGCLDGIAFGMAKELNWLSHGKRIDVLGYLQVNRWKDRDNLQLLVTDLREVR